MVQFWQNTSWREDWEGLALPVYTFDSLELAYTTPDIILWQECQKREVVLVTTNRNDDGPDSLEAAIRAGNTPECLPVFTLGDALRFRKERDYAERTALKLLDYLTLIDRVRGAGRLYIP